MDEEEEEKGRERERERRARGTLEVLIYFNHVLSKDSLSLSLSLFPIHFSMSEHKIVSRTNQIHLINYANQIL